LWPELIYSVPGLGSYVQIGMALSSFIQALLSGNWSEFVSGLLDPLGIGFGNWLADAFGLGGRPKLGPGSATEDLIRYWARSLNPAIQLYSLRWAQLMQRGIPYSVSGGAGLTLRLAIDRELHNNLVAQGFAQSVISNFWKVSAHGGQVTNLAGQPLSKFDTPPTPVIHLPPPPFKTCPSGQTYDAASDSCVCPAGQWLNPANELCESACWGIAHQLYAALKLFPSQAAFAVELGALFLAEEIPGVDLMATAALAALIVKNERLLLQTSANVRALTNTLASCLRLPPLRRIPPPPPPGDPPIGGMQHIALAPIPVPMGIPLPQSALAPIACNVCDGQEEYV
jgi:hypothetical protein